MTEREVEDPVPGPGLETPEGAGPRKRRWLVMAGGVAVVVLVGVVLAVVRFGSGRGEAAAPPVPAGWRLESSLGLEVAVPGDWAINDYYCSRTTVSTVVRGQVWRPMCASSFPPPDKEAVMIGGEKMPAGAQSVTVRDTRVLRKEQVGGDGWYTGWLDVPKFATVAVHTRSAALTRQILDSVRWGDTDSNGCATRRPKAPGGAPGKAVAVVADPVEIGVCAYQGQDDLLTSSRKVTGEEARTLAAAVNSAQPGSNPDGSCHKTQEPEPDLVLRVRAPNGKTTPVWMTFEGCSDRGMRTATGRSQVSRALVTSVMEPLKTGWSAGSDLQ